MEVCDDPLSHRSFFGLQQHTAEPIHRAGNTLDLLISRADSELVESVNDTDPSISDHTAVHFTFTLPKPPHITKTISFHKIISINHVEFVD